METNVNPLMAKIKIPGRTFQLPSRGAMYQAGELASVDGEIHVHPLSAMNEISLKNPDQLFNGKAIEAVFAECVPDIKKPTQLFSRDIDAIMFFLRMVTYGPVFEIQVKHTCDGAKNHTYAVDLEKIAREIEFLDPTVSEEKFTALMPSGQAVKVHPIKFDHLIKLFQMNSGKQEFSEADTKKNLIFNLVNVIESVDGITDKAHIEQWLKSVSTPYHNRITEAIERTNEWGIKTTTALKCKDCAADVQVELPLNPISFFTE